MSLDGFVAGPNGEMDWMVFNWDNELMKYVTELTEPVDTIVLGRKLAQGFIPHWASVAADPKNRDLEAGKKFTETKKVVFSRTLVDSPWPNTMIARGEIITEINHLKIQQGKDIIAYGGANFISGLVKYNLIDEYHLFINPVHIGAGLSIFSDTRNDLTLVKSIQFDCGIVLLNYMPI